MPGKGIIIILLLAISGSTFAQNLNYKEVDSTSYALYTQEQWIRLIEFGEMAVKNGITYYYLNLRLGIAWYNTGDYYKAQKYFEKALKQNQTEQTATEYLFLIKILTNRPLSSDKYFAELDEASQENIDDQISYYKTSIYFEGGIKFSKYKNLENNEPLFRFIADQKISNRFKLGISTSYIGQHNASWGYYDQFEIGLLPSFDIASNTNLLAGWRYMHNDNKSEIESVEKFHQSKDTIFNNGQATYIIDSIITTIDHSKTITNLNAFFAGVEQYYRRFTFYAQGFIFIQNINADNEKLTNTTIEKLIVRNNFILARDVQSENIKTIGSSNFNNYYYQVMFGIYYVFPVLNDGLKIGLSSYIPLNDSFSKSVWIPTISLRLSEKIWFFGEWLQKKDIPLLYQNGNIYLNQSYELNRRITLGLNFRSSEKTQWYFTYLNEDKYYLTDESNNLYNSFIIGLNIKF